MRKSLLLIAVLGAVGFTLPAKAQDEVAKEEVSVQYTYTRLYVNSGALDVPGRSTPFTFNGGAVEGQYNFNNYLSAVGEFGGGAMSSFSRLNLSGSRENFSNWALDYLGGARLYLARGRINPFMELLLGDMRLDEGIHNPAAASNSFELLAGGGLDFTLSNRISIRPFEFDYVVTKFPDGQNNIQNGFRYSGGVIFRFGSR